jgi:hypothetical protein
VYSRFTELTAFLALNGVENTLKKKMNPIFSRDGRSFLYAVASSGQSTIYSQTWDKGQIIGAPHAVLKVPFGIPLTYVTGGSAFDFSRDLSTIVSVRRGGHTDLYFLSEK